MAAIQVQKILNPVKTGDQIFFTQAGDLTWPPAVRTPSEGNTVMVG